MASGHDKALHVLVEDNVAESVLVEILRRRDPLFLKTLKICVTGDARSIQSVMALLYDKGLRVAAVRDGDMGDNPKQNLFRLPGTQPPEKEILNNASVKDLLRQDYSIDVDDFLALNQDVNHHQWFEKLAHIITINQAALVQVVAKTYAASLSENEIDSVVTGLKTAIK